MNHLKHHLENQRFGRLTVIEYAGECKWTCKCDCGNVVKVLTGGLTAGKTRSCGCFLKEERARRPRTHGQSKTRLYNIWNGMKTRCFNSQNHRFKWYGGRGILVCEEWAQSFEAFRAWALANGYKDDLTIDRIDNDKGYSPDNCRWVEMKSQSRNRRNIKLITYNGKTQTLTEWGRETGLNFKTIWRRIYEDGWSIEEALTLPPNETKRGRYYESRKLEEV